MDLSIITINLNNKEGLQRTIDSVVAQTWNHFEWIIIDGGSTDGSKELIQRNQSHISFWCSEPDKGVYNAMNKGVRKAKGEYLLFLNSGDVFYDSTVLERVFSDGLKSDIVSGQSINMTTGEPLRRYDSNIVMQLYRDSINHQSTFIRRQLLEEINYDESLKIVSDWKFWLEAIIIQGCSFEVLDIDISRQDMTGISFGEKNHALLCAERERVLKELFPTRVLDLFEEFKSLSEQPINRNMDFLSENHPHLAVGIRKLISFITIVARKGKAS